MNTIEATPTAPTNGPDPHRDRSGASTAPSRSAGLLRLVHNLIAFGQALLHTLQASPAAGVLSEMTLRFGTRDLALIVARITRGLMLASALDERLISRAKRLDAPKSRGAAASGANGKQASPAPIISQQDDEAALLARLPTAQEIAARLRGKPIGVVLEQICHDLGITCEHPLWRDLNLAIITHGGSTARVFNDIVLRVRSDYLAVARDLAAATPCLLPLPASFALNGTGPP